MKSRYLIIGILILGVLFLFWYMGQAPPEVAPEEEPPPPVEPEEPPPVEPEVECPVDECTADEDCDGDEQCLVGEEAPLPECEPLHACETLEGECGYAENHTWIEYECCEDADCEQGYACIEDLCTEIEPEIQANENIEIRGAILEESSIWDRNLKEETIDYLKSLGVNYISYGVHYEIDFATHEITPKYDRDKIIQDIEMIHEKGLKVFLAPKAEYIGCIPYHFGSDPRDHYVSMTNPTSYLNDIEEISKEWAVFAEENGVEMFGLWHDIAGDMVESNEQNDETVSDWYQEMLPQIREIYSGDVVVIESTIKHDYSGYDYLLIEYCDVPPDAEGQDGTPYLTLDSLRHFKDLVRDYVPEATEMREEAGPKGIIFNEIRITEIDNDHINDDATILAEAYDTVLSETEGEIEGHFFRVLDEQDPEIEEVIKNHYLE